MHPLGRVTCLCGSSQPLLNIPHTSNDLYLLLVSHTVVLSMSGGLKAPQGIPPSMHSTVYTWHASCNGMVQQLIGMGSASSPSQSC
jgi:hypothetical protein